MNINNTQLPNDAKEIIESIVSARSKNFENQSMDDMINEICGEYKRFNELY